MSNDAHETTQHSLSPPFAMFSATRQWNPGDEFILAGTRRILHAALGEYQPVIYDRNPDVRPGDGTTTAYRNVKRPDGAAGELYDRLSPVLRLGFFSNSVKFDSDMSFASLGVIAGSPEWTGPRCWNFYDHVIRNRMPLIALGVGSTPASVPDFMDAALRKAVALTTRSKTLAASDFAHAYGIGYLPCPALLSAPRGRQVDGVSRVGIAIGVPFDDSVWANSLDPDFYKAVCDQIDGVLGQYGDSIEFEFVAHYIDEIPVLARRFPEHAIRYSFDSAEYADIFNRYDLVISTRVHACGIAASSGVPSISLGHDFRSDTTAGFLSVEVDALSKHSLTTSFEALAGQASVVSSELAIHRAATLEAYVELLQSRFAVRAEHIDYGIDVAVPLDEAVDTMPHPDDIEAALDSAATILEGTNAIADELDAARTANAEMRDVLDRVEASKAEMAIELSGARDAVRQLERRVTELDGELRSYLFKIKRPRRR